MEFDYQSRGKITKKLESALDQKIKTFSKENQKIANEAKNYWWMYSDEDHPEIKAVAASYYKQRDKKPSDWFLEKSGLIGKQVHKEILDAFVPQECQDSFLYIIDKMNQFPYAKGWSRRCERTADYGPSMEYAFCLLRSYQSLFYFGTDLSALILRKLSEEQLDYLNNEERVTRYFYFIYAAEIDRGNQAVIDALKSLILSENNTAYLDREMIRGIICSDNQELHKLLGDLLLAARLQEGLRQAICESMDEGTKEAFLTLLKVVTENDLIRYASVKRALSTWIGICDEHHVDRVNGKMLDLMNLCLMDPGAREELLAGEDAIGINIALWSKGFYELEDAIAAMEKLLFHGTRHQILAASFYNGTIYDKYYRSMTAKKAIIMYHDDMELVACFMNSYLSNAHSMESLFVIDEKKKNNYYRREVETPKKVKVTEFYESREEAEQFYELFSEIYGRLPKKGAMFDPCIFPWYRVELEPSAVIFEICFAAYVLGDEERITKAAELAESFSSYYAGGYYTTRGTLINLLLFEPQNLTQRKLVLKYVGNADASAGKIAYQLVSRMELETEDYQNLEDMLRFKRSSLRPALIDLLMKQQGKQLEQSICRLLEDKKEEKRIAGLDMLLQLKKTEKKEVATAVIPVLSEYIQNPTDKEQILIQELTSQNEALQELLNTRGYGIYEPDTKNSLPELTNDFSQRNKCLPLKEAEIIGILKKLDAFIVEHQNYEYKSDWGVTRLFGNHYDRLEKSARAEDAKGLDLYPLAQELKEFCNTNISSIFAMYQIQMFLDVRRRPDVYGAGKKIYQALFFTMPFSLKTVELAHEEIITNILRAMRVTMSLDSSVKKEIFEQSVLLVTALIPILDNKSRRLTYEGKNWRGQKTSSNIFVANLPILDSYLSAAENWETEEEFRRVFAAGYRLELKCQTEEKENRFMENRRDGIVNMHMSWFFYAYKLGMITLDSVYQAFMEQLSLDDNLLILTRFIKGDALKPMYRWPAIYFFGRSYYDTMQEKGIEYMKQNTMEGKLCQEMYDKIVPFMVDVELRRGESETVFSKHMQYITYFAGIPYLIRILMALGKDSLDRESYYFYTGGYSYSCIKKAVLSKLLKSCYPTESETAADLTKALKKTTISESRLIEVAMFAPQWIDLIEAHLGWKGLKSGCYYFMAHMNERFDDKKKAMIARYTPISPEDLQAGAFDIHWFFECYQMLGESRFTELYNSAKYISDGQAHTRARKYADAATGKVKIKDLKEEIIAKRNKDLLMSYGLVPFGKNKEKDMLERYQYFQKFLKESKQFGAQRRASEAKAVEIGLTNLSVYAGFSDVTRLTLNMETRLMESFQSYMDWKTVGEIEVKLSVGEDGKGVILCKKNGKELKSIPSKYGKDAYIVDIKEINKNLKEQYSRTRYMMEDSMENQIPFLAKEVKMLFSNPVAKAIIQNLVFVTHEKAEEQSSVKKEDLGYFSPEELALVSADGTIRKMKEEDEICIAHPLHLFQAGVWHEYQADLFVSQKKQIFKQVFRELYVKLDEERDMQHSLMFAGNQIQPQRTVGCLKSRHWIADYEEGLQKIYYKENIIARIYALADWFSPSDVEAPTLEWVEFSDRKTFQPILIKDVPDIIYSEVMRDVDLAVSVAHAGGVDPETSHSTIEMRHAIVEFNLPLFGLTNVTLTDSHALIQGKRASYNVHLGSGVVHQEGGAMLHILPVHSQSRGKLFLPFVDEDPKTAEIMSKIVLLAEDSKIKDPSILDQIH